MQCKLGVRAFVHTCSHACWDSKVVYAHSAAHCHWCTVFANWHGPVFSKSLLSKSCSFQIGNSSPETHANHDQPNFCMGCHHPCNCCWCSLEVHVWPSRPFAADVCIPTSPKQRWARVFKPLPAISLHPGASSSDGCRQTRPPERARERERDVLHSCSGMQCTYWHVL